MSEQRFFGEIPGVPPGTVFPSRQALHDAGVHLPVEAGISGSETEGADSIVISGGYQDDEDYGDYIIYTGGGGRDRGSTAIVRDQSFTGRNRALAVSMLERLPVRVIRGAGGDPAYSPATGFRYDGVFFVERYWEDRIPYAILRFRLVRSDVDSPAAAIPEGGAQSAAERRETTQQRIVRNFKLAEQIKRANDHYCQVCGERIDTSAGPYAEAAHIRPIGRPHDGPDAIANLLCLCPNDHKRLDTGAIWIDEQRRVFRTADGSYVGLLTTVGRHIPDPAHLQYHREHISSVGQTLPTTPD
jgi:putative restriction endonuclease